MSRPDPARIATLRCATCGRWIVRMRFNGERFEAVAWRRPGRSRSRLRYGDDGEPWTMCADCPNGRGVRYEGTR